jgi:hypothetical protein
MTFDWKSFSANMQSGWRTDEEEEKYVDRLVNDIFERARLRDEQEERSRGLSTIAAEPESAVTQRPRVSVGRSYEPLSEAPDSGTPLLQPIVRPTQEVRGDSTWTPPAHFEQPAKPDLDAVARILSRQMSPAVQESTPTRPTTAAPKRSSSYADRMREERPDGAYGMVPSFQEPARSPRPTQEDERGFLGNLWESTQRGQRQADLDIMGFEAVTGMRSTEEVQEAIRQFRASEEADPIEADNWASGVAHAAARTIPAMAMGAAQGAVAGALGAGVASIATGPGALLAAAVGGSVGSMQYWYRQGVGSSYNALIEQGVDPNIAAITASVVGVPYAWLGHRQLEKVAPTFAKKSRAAVGGAVSRAIERTSQRVGLGATQAFGSVPRTLARSGATFVKEGVEEVVEEVSQEFVHILGEEVGVGHLGLARGHGCEPVGVGHGELVVVLVELREQPEQHFYL